MIDYKTLIQKAMLAMQNSHSPYSHFKVGACLVTSDGEYFFGTNVENASFGGTICAERNAINQAVSSGKKNIVAIAIVSQSGDYTYPCGLCRQSMVEFNPDMQIVVAKSEDDYKVYSASELLPFFFNGGDIKWKQL